MYVFFCKWYGDHRDLHVLTHSCPTRRSSDHRMSLNLAKNHIRAQSRTMTVDDFILALVPDIAPDPEQVAFARLEMERAFQALHAMRSEELTSELQSLMSISYAVFCLKKKNVTVLENGEQSDSITTVVN